MCANVLNKPLTSIQPKFKREVDVRDPPARYTKVNTSKPRTQSHRVLSYKLEKAAGVLRLPDRVLNAYLHYQTNQVDLCHVPLVERMRKEP